MNTYLILKDPGFNKVYYSESKNMSLSELSLALGTFTDNFETSIETIGGLPYYSFSIEEKLTKANITLLSKLSFTFALFEKSEIDEQTYLKPLNKVAYEYMDQKITTILRYPGKTNEQFTKMMINVALLSSDYKNHENITLLDPIAGRGTTLYEGTVNGFNVIGMEIEKSSVHDIHVFFKKYMEKERVKHSYSKKKIYGNKVEKEAYNHIFTYGKSKQDFKDQEKQKTFSIINGDTSLTHQYIKHNSVHIMVGDLPYGVAHGNKKDGEMKRSPYDLLNKAIPSWKKVLKKGGTIVLAWNKFVAPKEQLAQVFEDNGFEVLNDEVYNNFEHMVDSSIKRDIIVAKKK